MNGEEWERIKQIFEAATRIPHRERDAFLEAACSSHEHIRETIRELLSNHDAHSSSFLEELSIQRSRVFLDGQLVAARFRIVRFISRGAMGEVYEAYDERLRVRLAIKTLRPELAADRCALDRFRREISITREIVHVSICRVFDLIEHTDERDPFTIVPCLTMQLLEGESLLAFLERERPLTPDCALPWIRQIADGLQVLHDNGVVHRDLKPSNIMLTRGRNGEQRAVVMDFGLAKSIASEANVFESQLDFRAGAPYFMAPEVLRGEKPSPSSDIYSLGMVIDEMVTPTRAFTGESLQVLYYQKLWELPVAPLKRAPGLSPVWNDAILQCLAQKPENRFASVSAIVEALERVDLPLVPRRAPAGSGMRRTLLTRRKLIPAVLAPVAFGVAATIALRPRREEPTLGLFPFANNSSLKELDAICRATTDEVYRRLCPVVTAYDASSNSSQANRSVFTLRGRAEGAPGSVVMKVALTNEREKKQVGVRTFAQDKLQDAITVQNEIVNLAEEAIVAYRRSQPAPLHWPASSKPPLPPLTPSSAALENYILARQCIEESNLHSVQTGLDLLDRAIHIDPNFALAYSAKSDAQFVLIDYSFATTPVLLTSAWSYAQKAVALNPNIPETQTSLAAAQQALWQWDQSRASYQTALQINPPLPRALRWYGGLLIQFGEFEEGLKHARAGIALEPDHYPSYIGYGLYLFCARQYPEAIRVLSNAISRQPHIGLHHNLGNVYAWKGYLTTGSERAEWFRKAFEQAEAIAQLETKSGYQAGPGSASGYSDRVFAHFYALAGDHHKARPYLERMIHEMKTGRVSPAVLISTYTALGDTDRALDLLEAAAAIHDRKLLYARVEPFFESLAAFPRYKKVLNNMRLV